MSCWTDENRRGSQRDIGPLAFQVETKPIPSLLSARCLSADSPLIRAPPVMLAFSTHFKNARDCQAPYDTRLLFALNSPYSPQYDRAVVGGLLSGLGTSLGGGCTSGHGICGLSMLSPRSLVFTLTFMAAAAGSAIMTDTYAATGINTAATPRLVLPDSTALSLVLGAVVAAVAGFVVIVAASARRCVGWAGGQGRDLVMRGGYGVSAGRKRQAGTPAVRSASPLNIQVRLNSRV